MDTRISEYKSTFDKALATLNESQRRAVEQVDGAVLVVAGPGTGKTQLLAARIGYILQNTDTVSGNILCLTFTDAGAVAMRKRLLQFIGPEAYNVSIYTFHAFCNKVINENIEYFGGYFDLQAITELEQVQILKRIIDEFDHDHPLKRFKGNIYYDRKNLMTLFSTIKSEGWDPKELIKDAHDEVRKAEEDPDNRYKRNGKGYQKGDIKKNAIKKVKDRMDRLIAGVQEFEKYEKYMQEAQRFDFNDMILWVIDKFKTIPDLLLEYQEKYHYILVDEYQDTNGSQNQIIDLLTNYWEDPNVFAVGDDDQAIFRFQGANLDNIELFKEKYNPRLIVLENNYRSSQEILDSATALIQNNTKRLVNTYADEFSKTLVASRNIHDEIKADPVIRSYPNITQEEISIANEIIALHEKGEQLSEVAVIYRNHANANNIVKYLELRDVPLNIKRRLNILDTPEILRVINILDYIENEGRYIDSANAQLFELLHYEYFDLKPRDIGKVAIHCSRRTDAEGDDITWDKVLTDKQALERLGVGDVDRIMETYSMLQGWISDSKNMTLQVLFGKILTDGNIINTIMNSSDKVWRLQVINTFFDFIKEESVKKPDLSLSDLLGLIEMMNTNDISMPYEKIVSNVEGVNFITAHASKGLEFKYVYMIRSESNNWEAKRKPNTGFKFPSQYQPSSEKSDEEDLRRLFFVAMTRAKDYLYISYPEATDEEKGLEPSKFLTEIQNPKYYESQRAGVEEVIQYKADLLRYTEAQIELIDHDLIDRVLENYSMSVTNLNKYLECPLRFYFESILRVPQARNANTGFGKSIHYALEQLFIYIDKDPENKIPDLDKVIQYFYTGMDMTRSHYTSQEYDNLKEYGKRCLTDYYNEYHTLWGKAHHYKVEYKIDLTHYDGVPIKGVLDRLDIYQNHVEVVDYKTGKYDKARENLKPSMGDEDPGGRYWRQIVFYKMLLDSDPNIQKPMKVGTMDFVEHDNSGKLRQVPFEVDEFEMKVVAAQLKEAYRGIQNHEFQEGCNEEFCRWCNFVNNNFALEETLEMDEGER